MADIKVRIHLSNGEYVDIDKINGLKSVESLSQSTGQPKDIFYGVVPSSGSLEIIDINGNIAQMVKEEQIPISNAKMEIIANNKNVQTHLTGDSNYNVVNGSKVFDAQLENELSAWDKIDFAGYRLNSEKSLYDVLVEVLSSVYEPNEIEIMVNSTIINGDNDEETVKSYLEKIIIKHPYMQKGTLRQAIDKICSLAQLNVLENDKKEIKFVSARPLIVSNNKITKIAKRNQNGAFDVDIFIKNKHNSVNVKYEETSLKDLSLDNRTIKLYNYTEISQKLQDYEYVLESKGYNPNLTILHHRIPHQNNPSYGSTGNHWYYSIVKYDISYDVYNLKILRDFVPKISDSTNSIHPTNEIEKFSKSSTSTQTIQPVDYSLTDEEIISDWITKVDFVGEVVKSGSPNFGYKIRRNIDETYTVFVLMLDMITNKSISMSGTQEDIIVAVYNELNIDFSAPEITQATISKNNNDLFIESNELMQDTALFETNKLSGIIENNILSDYHNGIRTGSLTVNCLDYYDIDGNKSKEWTKGEILQVGDVVRVDADNDGNSAIKYHDGSDVYFKITSRAFRHSGVPLIDLQLQEVLPVDCTFFIGWTVENGGLNFNYSLADFIDLYVNNKFIDREEYYDGVLELVMGDVIKINFKESPSINHYIKGATINGESYISGTEYVIKGFTNFVLQVKSTSGGGIEM